MSGAGARAHGRPYREHAVAVRTNTRSGEGQTYVGPGYLYCDGCGSSSVTKADFADKAGVTPRMLNRWLAREPVPQPVANAIRANLLAVAE